jgi:uncharacterized protein YbjT (DUF2867 family)
MIDAVIQMGEVERTIMILVTGATGNVGRHVVEQLVADGEKVRAITRNPQTANLPPGAEVVGADPSRPETLAAALEGVTVVFLNPAALRGAIDGFLSVAHERGVTRAVLLSSAAIQDGQEPQPEPIAAGHKVIEDAIEASGLRWTFLRPGEFAANSLYQWARQIRASGVVRGAHGRAQTAPIHERDIAAVAVHALRSEKHAQAKYTLTGPQSLTQFDKVQIIGAAIGRPLRFEELSPAEGLQLMIEHGAPEAIARTLLGFQADAVGHAAQISSAVPDLLGRPALTFSTWAGDHVTAFQS